MKDLSHSHHLDDEKHKPRGWLASSGTLPIETRSTSWSSEWDETFPLLGAAVTFLADAGSAIRRKVSFLDSQISTDRGRLTRSYHSTRTSSLSIIPSLSAIRFILLCSLWYMSSAMSSNTGKTILIHFSNPVTLTFLQFAFVSGYSALFMSPVVRFSKIRRPNRAILLTTLPMGAFQVGGHIFSSMAISRIHVSTVHTIKALSPLFTVAAYALLFKVSYSAKTYISLLPLTFGVMLVCTFDISASNFVGILCAFGSAIVFVTSNIFFKKVMPSGGIETSSHKLDKLNLLFYSSGMAFLLMIPIWSYCNLPLLMTSYQSPTQISLPVEGSDAPSSAAYYLFLNGSAHFAQNIIAFTILASTSPVTYSIASLIKRVAVICIAIVWFAQTVHPVQAIGIAMTFIGLYMYNQAKGDIEKGESKMRRVDAARDLRLPLTTGSIEHLSPPPPMLMNEPVSITSAHDRSWTNPSPPTQRPLLTNEITNELSSEIGRRDTMTQHHPQPNLHIKIHPPFHPISPQDLTIDSYPSPPESVDSPPSSTVPLVNQNQHAINSWMSKRNGPVSATAVSNPSVQESAMVSVIV